MFTWQEQVGSSGGGNAPDFIGTIIAPQVITVTGIDINSAINNSFFVTAYVTTLSDIIITANPQISPGFAEGQRLIIWYVGSFSLTIRDADGVESNGDLVCTEGFRVEYQWANGVWYQLWATE